MADKWASSCLDDHPLRSRIRSAPSELVGMRQLEELTDPHTCKRRIPKPHLPRPALSPRAHEDSIIWTTTQDHMSENVTRSSWTLDPRSVSAPAGLTTCGTQQCEPELRDRSQLVTRRGAIRMKYVPESTAKHRVDP